jgi:ureidoacrylate peracid hydrolase
MTQVTDPRHATYLPKNESTLRFPVQQTALLVIDPVNDFLSEGGAGWEMVKATVKMNNVIENLQEAIAGARGRGISVLFAPMAFTEADYAQHQLQRRCGINRLMYENRMFLAGSWGADFHPELQPQPDEIVLQPHKTNDVFETDLPQHLERLGITHLVIAGMTANLCCEATGRHATELGYDVTFLSDTVGAAGVLAYEAAIRVNYPLVANAVIKANEFIAAIGSSTETDEDVRPNDKVLGSDHGEIGTVKEVVTDGAETVPHMVITAGLLQKDRYIPLDTIVKRSGNEVFINIPKLVISDMPWSEPPTAVARPSIVYGSTKRGEKQPL